MGVFDVQQEERRRESPAGMHFYGLYRECPRKWYLKYMLGLRPQFTSPAFLFGGAMHEALQVYYEGRGNLSHAQKAFRDELADRRNQYAELSKYTDDFNRGVILLEKFHDNIGKDDAAKYDIVETEHEYQIPFGPEESKFVFTIRPDRVFRRKDNGMYYPVEAKTSSYSVTAAGQAAERGDQVTGYLWGLSKAHPDWELGGCLIDVLYNKGKVFDAKRVENPAFRSKYELQVFEMGLYGTVVELTQKYNSLDTFPWPLIFPQHRSVCSHWGCEYMGVCFTPVKEGEVPPGFVRDEWKKDMSDAFKKTQDFTLDGISYEGKKVVKKVEAPVIDWKGEVRV